MDSLYPEESKKLDVIGHLEEFRRRLLYSIAVLAAVSVVSFCQIEKTMSFIMVPARGLISEMIFIGPTEAFVSCIKVAFLAGFIVTFPFLVFQTWAYIQPALSERTRRRVVLWIFFALFLFFSGISFSFKIAIPAALKFLIGFSSEIAEARITLGRYVSFFVALMLVGGMIFEIPVVIGLLTDAGIVKSRMLRKNRAVSVIVILVLAAVITPTQDIFNMLLFAVPMLVLFEAGIILSSFLEKHRS